MTHYFTNNEDLEHQEKSFDFHISNEVFNFKTDKGVFSRKNVDYGTKVLIENVLKNDLEKPILDLGCGYGAVSIVVSRILNSKVYAIDINERALRLTRENSLRNKVNVEAIYCEDLNELEMKFKTIIFNPPIRSGKENIFSLYEKSYQSLKEGGKLYIVIQKKHGAKSTYRKLLELFKDVRLFGKDKGYQVILAVKSQH